MGNYSSKETYFKFILYFVVIVLINIAGITMFFRADLTGDKIYSLSDASQDVVATLSEPLSIKVFFSKDLPAPHNNTERYLKDLLEEYSSKSGRLFNYTFYNVTPEEDTLIQKSDENRELAKNYGVNPIQIRIVENDEVKFKNAYMGLVIIHGDLIEKLPAITSTDGLEYQLTTSIQKLNNKVSAFLRMEKKVKVDMYLSQSLNQIAPIINLPKLPMLGHSVEKTITKLNKKSMNKLEFNHVAIDDREELTKRAKEYNLLPMSWPDIPKQNIKEGFGVAGLVIQYDGQTTTLPLINSFEIPLFGTQYQMAEADTLEQELNNVVEKMIGINKDIGFLSSHGTHAIKQDQAAMMQGRQPQAMRAFDALLSTRYTIKTIDLQKGSIPDGLNCLVIARPTKKFTDYELFQIDQALMKGTSIALISDSFEEVVIQQGGMGMPPMHNPIDTGLEKLLNHYGISIQKAYVLDKNCYRHILPPNQGGGEQNIYFAPKLKGDSINTDPGYMNNIKGLVVMQISPVSLIKENIDKDKVTATKLLSSSDQSWLMKSISLNPAMITPPKEESELQSYGLSYMLEGQFTSYFKGKPVPQKESKEEQVTESQMSSKQITAKTSLIESGKPARLLVLPSSAVIQDNMLDPQGRTTNATFIMNIIDHLNGQEKIAKLRAKQQTLNPLDDTSPVLRGTIKGFNIIGLPVLVILFGMGVLTKRTSKKKKLAKRFNA